MSPTRPDYACRECDEPLVSSHELGDAQWFCPKCGARVLALSAIERLASPAFVRALRQGIESAAASVDAGAICPSCRRTMRARSLLVDALVIVVDHCPACRLVRLDAGEFEQLPRKSRYVGIDHDALRRQLAASQVELVGRPDRKPVTIDAGDLSAPQLVLATLGLPVDVDASESHFPWLTWTLAVALVGAFLLQLGVREEVAREFAWIPARSFRNGGLTLVSSFFLHADWIHLIGNVYFLVAFGRVVEGRIGAARTLLLLAGAELAAKLAHAGLDPDPTVPLVGASGGLSGLILYYAASNPWNRIAVLVWVVRPRVWSVPAVAWAICWFLWQAHGLLVQRHGGSISAAAHLGGALAGFVAFLLARRRK